MGTEIMSATGMNQGDNLDEIYAWIDGATFSKPKKNLSRDFSDGVLMAEMLKAHYPRLVEGHNYIAASSVAAKRENWATLNRKVFSKIEMKLSRDVINQLANAQQGVIEKLLIDLRRKIFLEDDKNSVKIRPDETGGENDNGNSVVQSIEKQEIGEVSVAKNNSFIGKACGWFSGWIWPALAGREKEIPSTSISGGLDEESGVDSMAEETVIGEDHVDAEEEESASISRLDFLLLREEVAQKNAAIVMLNRKVSCLESVMKLKDQKIVNLAAKISAPIEAAQNLRPHVMGSSISRLRYQTRNKL